MSSRFRCITFVVLCVTFFTGCAKPEVTRSEGVGFVATKVCESPPRGSDWEKLYEVGKALWADKGNLTIDDFPQRYSVTQTATSDSVVVVDSDAKCTTTIDFAVLPISVSRLTDASINLNLSDDISQRYDEWLETCRARPEMEKLEDEKYELIGPMTSNVRIEFRHSCAVVGEREFKAGYLIRTAAGQFDLTMADGKIVVAPVLSHP